jgi:hypothetical protein
MSGNIFVSSEKLLYAQKKFLYVCENVVCPGKIFVCPKIFLKNRAL